MGSDFAATFRVNDTPTDLIFPVAQGLVKGLELCLNPYFFGWLEK